MCQIEWENMHTNTEEEQVLLYTKKLGCQKLTYYDHMVK